MEPSSPLRGPRSTASNLTRHSRILALIAAHNEAPRIAAVVAAAGLHLPVLVVDDGSSDQTAAVAERAGATVVRQAPNQGKGAALAAGFRWALERGSSAVVTLDADGQHDPAEIPLFLAAHERGAPELVIGYREFRDMPPIRRAANLVGGRLLSRALGRRIRDNQSGYRLVGRRLMAEMMESREKGFEFEIEMVVLCVREGWPLEWVPISTIYAGEESHIRPLHHALSFARAAWRARRRMRPGDAKSL